MKLIVIEYRVKGHGHIPLDMLRYDQSWPATSLEAEKMSAEIVYGDRKAQGAFVRPYNQLVEVQLHGLRCTPERWASFGWVVTEQRKIR